MNKDTFVISAIGFFIGVGVAVVLLFAPQFFNRTGTQSTNPLANRDQTQKQELTITTPTDGDVVTQKSITIEGSTAPKNQVVISGPIDETMTQAPDDGSFGVSLDLEFGENEITITSYNEVGEIAASTTIVVTYTDEEL